MHINILSKINESFLLVHDDFNFYNFGCVKASGLKERKMGCIGLILPTLRSFNRGSFHASQNCKNFNRHVFVYHRM